MSYFSDAQKAALSSVFNTVHHSTWGRDVTIYLKPKTAAIQSANYLPQYEDTAELEQTQESYTVKARIVYMDSKMKDRFFRTLFGYNNQRDADVRGFLAKNLIRVTLDVEGHEIMERGFDKIYVDGKPYVFQGGPDAHGLFSGRDFFDYYFELQS